MHEELDAARLLSVSQAHNDGSQREGMRCSREWKRLASRRETHGLKLVRRTYVVVFGDFQQLLVPCGRVGAPGSSRGPPLLS